MNDYNLEDMYRGLEKIMLNLDEKNDIDNADAIRDVMDILWYNMSEEMRKQLTGF